MARKKQTGGFDSIRLQKILNFFLSDINPIINMFIGVAFMIISLIFIGSKNTNMYSSFLTIVLIFLGTIIGLQIFIPIVLHIIKSFIKKVEPNLNSNSNSSSIINGEFINIIMNFVVIAIQNIGSLASFVLIIPFFNLIHIFDSTSKVISTGILLNILLGIFIFLCVYFLLINIFVMPNPNTEPNVLAFIGVFGTMLVILNSIFGLISYFISITSDNNLYLTILTISISAIIVLLNYILYYFKSEIRELDNVISKAEDEIKKAEGNTSWYVTDIHYLLELISNFLIKIVFQIQNQMHHLQPLVHY